MSLLELILVLALQFEGISGESIYIYKRPGQDVSLSCPLVSTCTSISWLYNRDSSPAVIVPRGNRRSSARLSLSSDCSLVIKNITAEDFGRYVCREGQSIDRILVYLSVLTISQSPPEADPKRDSEVTLECSLLTFTEDRSCQQNSFRWVDEAGTVLLDEGVRQTKCVSRLIVKHQSGHGRKYTCQLVDKENNVKIEGVYTPVFRVGIRNDEQEKSNSAPNLKQTYIIVGAVVGVVVVLVVIAAVLIQYRKRDKVTGDVQNPIQHPDEPESSLTYVTLSHANQKASPKKRVKKEEDEVTYSTVKTPAMTDSDPSNLYSSVGKPK